MSEKIEKKDYKSTLNLPQTDFPMKGNLPVRENLVLEKWAKIDLYGQLRKKGKGRKKFILHDGPPYANGAMHIGHAVNRTLKDIVVKSRTLSGYDAPSVPGWDCHGLPIELKVEKEFGKPGRELSVNEFRAACRKYAASQIDLQRDALKRLGLLGDWDHPYVTMDFQYEADIVRALSRIMANGHLRKGSKPVYWCLDCASALAEAEVEYADKKSPSIDVKYRIVDEPDVSVVIWTTTPWTLPASQAVSVHPEVSYVKVSMPSGESLILAEALVESAMIRYGISDYSVTDTFVGRKLEGVKLRHPFYDRVVPVVLGEHVTTETGTGAVHTAPAHGVDDWLMGKKYDLPMDNPVLDNGCFLSAMPLVGDVFVRKADDIILEELKKLDVMLSFSKITHSYPHCWRHKTPLIFRATPQWFISMLACGLKERAEAAAKGVEWIPDWGQNRMQLMLDNRPDWCISRQRVWGVPIALFLQRETGEPHPDSLVLLEKVAQRIEKHGIEVWDSLTLADLTGTEDEHYRKSMDVLDVWFDSGISHTAVLQKNPAMSFPADLYLEGSDQYRGWFQSALLTSVAMHGEAPYRAVLTHGYVVDADGRKMSKSLGNVIAPDKVIGKLGADILRLWISMADYRGEVVVSEQILSGATEIYRRIRNTARFLLANLHDFDPEKDMVSDESQIALDRYIVELTRRLQEEIRAAYDSYQFHQVSQKIYQFCAMDLGGFYLDIIKDRQYTLKKDSVARRSAQTAIWHILQALVRWMAPVLTFTAEEIHEYLPGKQEESVFLGEWYENLAVLPESDHLNYAFWQKLRAVRDAVNGELEIARKDGKIGSALEAQVTLYCDAALKKQLDMIGDELRFVLITSGAVVIAETAGEGAQTAISGLSVKVGSLQDIKKCQRCWHRRADVGHDINHPDLCERCVENIDGSGEDRQYA